MRIKTKFMVTLFAVLLTVFVQACSGVGISSTASNTSNTAFDMETSVVVNEVEIEPEMNSNVLRIKEMNLEAGQLVFKLTSPDGHIQWQEAFTAPAEYHQTFDLDLTPGTWTLEIELEDATGNYGIEWRASD